MEHYVTLFDSLYLPQGLALHSSMENYAGLYTLWVLCMDEESKLILDKLKKPNLKTIALSEVETPELLSVKSTRSKVEYCWTLTPSTPKIVFDRDESVQRVTYLDADLFFLKDVAPIFHEFEQSEKAVLITEHSYSPKYDTSLTCGRFCVQFMIFVREASEPVRTFWQAQCVEWCFDKIEDGKFGDQKYLDDWPNRFSKLVHILNHKEWILGPWNAEKFSNELAIVYHFTQIRLFDVELLCITGKYKPSEHILNFVYKPYAKSLKMALNDLECVEFNFKSQIKKRKRFKRAKLNIFIYILLQKFMDYKCNHILHL